MIAKVPDTRQPFSFLPVTSQVRQVVKWGSNGEVVIGWIGCKPATALAKLWITAGITQRLLVRSVALPEREYRPQPEFQVKT
ncbi:MAG: hypothetical protein FJ194_11085 [Gammaproteobacteria bacterium]|nr:hypothetical protein [Gammaproteobacteria bacterium]